MIQRLIDVSKGLADIPDMTPAGYTKVCQNYEFDEVNAITQRLAMTTWGNDFATFLDTEQFQVLKVPDSPFYSPNLPTDIHSDHQYLIPAFIFNIVEGFKVRLFYRKNDGDWTYTDSSDDDLLKGIYGDGVVYTENSDPVFYYGRVLYIADGVNNCQYVAIDKQGTVRSGKMGLLAPDSIPIVGDRIINTTVNSRVDIKMIKTDKGILGTGNPSGVFAQYCYTVVDKFGAESNPSPIGVGFVNTYQTVDDSDDGYSYYQYLEYVLNIKVPYNLSIEAVNNLVNFNVYRRVSLYKEGYGYGSWKKVGEIAITNKTKSMEAGTYNVFKDSNPVTATDISYSNDIAPVANEISEINGTPVLGWVSSIINFIFPVQNYLEINITNLNNELYAGWNMIQIRFTRAELVAMLGDDFSTYFTDTNTVITNSNSIIFLYIDGMTPIPCNYVYNAEDEGSLDYTLVSLDFYIALPAINTTELIYFCWGVERPANLTDNEDNGFFSVKDYGGVNVKDVTLGYMYGKPIKMASASYPDDTEELLHNYDFVRSYNSTLVLDCVYGGTASNLLSTRDLKNKVSLYGLQYAHGDAEMEWGADDTFIQFYPSLFSVGETGLYKHIRAFRLTSGVSPDPPTPVTASASHYVQFVTSDFPNNLTGTNNVGKFSGGFVALGGAESTPSGTILIPFANKEYEDGTHYRYMCASILATADGAYSVSLKTYYDDGLGALSDIIDTIELSNLTKAPFLYIGYSYTPNTVAGVAILTTKLFVAEIDTDGTVTSQISSASTFGTYKNVLDGDDFVVYFNEGTNCTFTSIHYSGFESGNEYIDTQAKWEQIMKRFPLFRDASIGWDGSTTNANIAYNTSDVKSIEVESYPNAIMWGSQDSLAIPSTNINLFIPEKILRIAPTSSFLQLTHQNVLAVFTRNGLYLMPQSGLTFSSENIIRESTNLGLLARNSFKITDKQWIWLSENGLMVWDNSGRRSVSENMVTMPVNSECVGYRIPIKDQYWLLDYDKSDISISNLFGYDILMYAFDAHYLYCVLSDGVTLNQINLSDGSLNDSCVFDDAVVAISATEDRIFIVTDLSTDGTLYVYVSDTLTQEGDAVDLVATVEIGAVTQIDAKYTSNTYYISLCGATEFAAAKYDEQATDFTFYFAGTAVEDMVTSVVVSSTTVVFSGTKTSNSTRKMIRFNPTTQGVQSIESTDVGTLDIIEYADLDLKVYTGSTDSDFTGYLSNIISELSISVGKKQDDYQIVGFASDSTYLYIVTTNSILVIKYVASEYTFVTEVACPDGFIGIAPSGTDGIFFIVIDTGFVIIDIEEDADPATAYVYTHAQNKFSTFYGLDMRINTGLALTGGTTVDNINLFFYDNYVVSSYPVGTTLHTAYPAVCTVELNSPIMDDHAIRFIVHGTAGTSNTVAITAESPERVTDKTATFSPTVEKRYNIPPGFFGTILTFVLTNFSKIRLFELITTRLRAR